MNKQIQILKRPIITEKSMKLAKTTEYTFEVDKDSNKKNIKKEIEGRFGVTVLNVKIINVKDKLKPQRGRRRNYKIPGFKKAIIQLKKGQVIAIFETPKEDQVAVTTAENLPEVKEKKNFFKGTKVKVEKGVETKQTTQRKVITGR